MRVPPVLSLPASPPLEAIGSEKCHLQASLWSPRSMSGAIRYRSAVHARHPRHDAATEREVPLRQRHQSDEPGCACKIENSSSTLRSYIFLYEFSKVLSFFLCGTLLAPSLRSPSAYFFLT